ncbi:hypothetical protein N7488_010551 [Penicillium malachiteum]|nr:hypothetical protein N7488_010551 [Penicillium malachiteum]
MKETMKTRNKIAAVPSGITYLKMKMQTTHEKDVTDDEQDQNDDLEHEEDMKIFDKFEQVDAERAALSYPHHSVSFPTGHAIKPRRSSLKRRTQKRKQGHTRQNIADGVYQAEENGGSYNRGFQPSEKMELLARADGKSQLEETDMDEDTSRGCKGQALCGALHFSLSFSS